MLENEQLDDFKKLSDAELIRLYKNGSQTAFQQLALRYIFIIRNKSSEFHNAFMENDDLLQEGLLGLHNAVCSFNENSNTSFRTYAGICIRNRLVSAVRAANAEKNKINNSVSSIDTVSDIPIPSNCEPENVFIINEELTSLLNYIKNNLSSTELSVLSCYLDGMTYKQIAAKLNLTGKACDNAMQRVRKKLKIKG